MKWLKRSFIIFVIVIAAAAISAFVLAYIYQKEVKQFFVEQLNNHLATPVKIDSYNLSLLQNFPYASLEFEDVTVKENTNNRVKADLLTAQSIYLKFNLMDLFSKDYKIKKLEIDGAALTLHVDKNGNPNYIFWKKSSGNQSNQKFTIELNNITLKNIDVTYVNDAKESKAIATVKKLQLSGRFGSDKYKLKTNGDFFIKEYSEKDVTWLKNSSIQIDNSLKINNEANEIAFPAGQITLDGIAFKISGMAANPKMADEYQLQLQLAAKYQEVGVIKNLVPYSFQKDFDNYDLKGKASFDIKVSGTLSRTQTPRIDANFNVEGVQVENSRNDTKLENLSSKGKFVYFNDGNKQISQLHLNTFHFNIKQSHFDGTFSLTNFFKPYVKVDVNADLPLKPLVQFLGWDTVQNPSGEVVANVKFQGFIKNLKNIKPEEYQKINATGQIALKDVGFDMKNSNVSFSKLNGVLLFDKHLVKAENITFNSQHSDFEINGELQNFLAWLFTGKEKLNITATLKSKNLYLDELLFSNSDDDDENPSIHFRTDISCKLDAQIGHFVYKRFEASNITGEFVYNNRKMALNNLTFNSMDGKVDGNLFFSQNDKNQITTNLKADLTHINVQKLFYDFHNFDQNTLGAANLQGFFDAAGNFSCQMDSTLKVNEESIKLHSNLTINNGELTDFEPVYALSKYIKMDELKDIHFSKLTTEVNIQNDTIFFPETNINSSALDLKFFGSHTFDNKIDYHFAISFRELLWNKAKRKKKQNEQFGYVVDDGSGGAKLFIKMTGDLSDPKISYDRKGLAKKLKSDFKTRTNDLKQVLHNQYGWFKKDTSLNKENNSQPKPAPYKIEWNPDGDSASGSNQEKQQTTPQKNDSKKAKKTKTKKKSFFQRLTTPNKSEYVQPPK